MRVNSMRWLDRWIGAPFSTTLTVIRHMRDRFSSAPDGDPKKILFIKLVEQGATVIAEPAIRRAVEMVGRENVYVAVFRQNRFILDLIDVIPPENVITIRSRGIWLGALDTYRAIRRIHRCAQSDVVTCQTSASRATDGAAWAQHGRAHLATPTRR